MKENLPDTRRVFHQTSQKSGEFYSLPALEQAGYSAIHRLPVSIRYLLESVLRNYDGVQVTREHVETLARWMPVGDRVEVPLTVGRVILQDFTGTPLVCDLAAMRSTAARLGKAPELVEPLVPVQLVIDHSVQINAAGTPDALARNMELELERNRERYEFFKWGTQAFEKLTIVPPGRGIVHQINLEHLAKGVLEREGIYFPDSLVGTDSHTTMINGIGVLGWGVGGIEAEAAMLGQPVFLVAPDVVGVELTGRLRDGVTITDAVLTVTEQLRQANVVGKFVEFFGDGTANLSATDRATIANMAPEYGATMGFFPVDDRTIAYYGATGRAEDEVMVIEAYYRAQGLFGSPAPGSIDYSSVVEIDLSRISPSVAGPKRPQDRIELGDLAARFDDLYAGLVEKGGYGRDKAIGDRIPLNQSEDGLAGALPDTLGHGDILIAAITSCTNTSNPGVLLTAGLLAKKAVEAGLAVPPWIKTSFAPGSRVVTEYLNAAGLMPALENLGFGVAAYGCAVCAGNSGPLNDVLDAAIAERDLICVAVLSGNRNFEARIHPALRANFLMSPPLVIAYAIAGSVRIDLTHEPLGRGFDGTPVYLADIWPGHDEVEAVLVHADNPAAYRRAYASCRTGEDPWNAIDNPDGATFTWRESTYIAEPPFFDDFTAEIRPPPPVSNARILAILGDSITTDHISPAGVIDATSPAGVWLQEQGVQPCEFNTYGARRGHHEVMMRGAFANVRLRNLMTPDLEGGMTRIDGESDPVTIFEAAEMYRRRGIPLVVIAGQEYGCGSSRDWAAKGTVLLGVRAVIARGFERIHRSNLIGMGVLPCQFTGSDSAYTLGLDGTETIEIEGLKDPMTPRSTVKMVAVKPNGEACEARLLVRIDSSTEATYFRHGGVSKYMLRKVLFLPQR